MTRELLAELVLSAATIQEVAPRVWDKLENDPRLLVDVARLLQVQTFRVLEAVEAKNEKSHARRLGSSSSGAKSKRSAR